jgi:hypothetical protein
MMGILVYHSEDVAKRGLCDASEGITLFFPLAWGAGFHASFDEPAAGSAGGPSFWTAAGG